MRMRIGRGTWIRGAAVAAVLGASLVTTAAPLVVNEDAKLTASDAATGDWFGSYWGQAVAASGDTIVVGAVRDDDAGVDSGSAYVFGPDGAGGWTETAKLTASDAAAREYFGEDVAVSGDTIVVGAIGGTGSAYVFTPDGAGGYDETKLTASDAAAGDYFGYSVAVSGDTIVVGAGLDQDAGHSAGSAYVFGPDGAGGWTETAKLTASDARRGHYYGTSVAVSGEMIVVGASDYGTDRSGSAYVYTPAAGGGYDEVRLIASDAVASDSFGVSVDVSGDTIVVGASVDGHLLQRVGAAYVYTPAAVGGGYDEVKLTPSDAAIRENVARYVAVSGDTIVLGAHTADVGGTPTGAAWTFARDGAGVWTESEKLVASDPTGVDYFGAGVAISGGVIVVAAPIHDHGGLVDAGAVYVFGDSFPAPPPPINEGPDRIDILMPTVVRAPTGGGTLVVSGNMDLGDQSLDLSQPCTLTLGTEQFAIPGLTERPRRSWKYRSPDKRLSVVVRTSVHRTSNARVMFCLRGWDGVLGAGNTLTASLVCPPYDAQCEVVIPPSGLYKVGSGEFNEPAMALRSFRGLLNANPKKGDRVTILGYLAGDGTVPAVAPDLEFWFGGPNDPDLTVIDGTNYTIMATPNGYDYRIKGTGHPAGIWRVVVDYSRRCFSVYGRGMDLGVPNDRIIPMFVGFGEVGARKGMLFQAARRGKRLTY